MTGRPLSGRNRRFDDLAQGIKWDIMDLALMCKIEQVGSKKSFGARLFAVHFETLTFGIDRSL